MNIRKPIDYSAMYTELDEILSKNYSQMEEIYAIGRTILQTPRKRCSGHGGRVFTGELP